MKSYCGTNRGKIRANNEDNFIVIDTENYYMCAVADGMGGHNAGEIASAMVINTIKNCFMEVVEEHNIIKIPKFINESLYLANKEVFEQSIKNKDQSGMGTTLTMAVIDKIEFIAYVGNVGDSRTYLINEDSINQITDDHTYVQELLQIGEISDDDAKKHSRRNVITRAVGSEKDITIDIFEIELNHDDVLLLCSDGLTNHISDDEIYTYLKKYGPNCVEKLIDLANENGGTDNITVIVTDISDRGER